MVTEPKSQFCHMKLKAQPRWWEQNRLWVLATTKFQQSEPPGCHSLQRLPEGSGSVNQLWHVRCLSSSPWGNAVRDLLQWKEQGRRHLCASSWGLLINNNYQTQFQLCFHPAVLVVPWWPPQAPASGLGNELSDNERNQACPKSDSPGL